MSAVEHHALLCPECAQKTTRAVPIVVRGLEAELGGGVTMIDSDRVVGWLLEPCGHRVKGVRIFYDEELSRSVAEFEPFDPDVGLSPDSGR